MFQFCYLITNISVFISTNLCTCQLCIDFEYPKAEKSLFTTTKLQESTYHLCCACIFQLRRVISRIKNNLSEVVLKNYTYLPLKWPLLLSGTLYSAVMHQPDFFFHKISALIKSNFTSLPALPCPLPSRSHFLLINRKSKSRMLNFSYFKQPDIPKLNL